MITKANTTEIIIELVQNLSFLSLNIFIAQAKSYFKNIIKSINVFSKITRQNIEYQLKDIFESKEKRKFSSIT